MDKDESVKEEAVSGGQILINMEGMIKNHISSLDRLSSEMKKYRDMLNDIFEQDPTFREHSEKAKEAAKVKQKTKAEILKRPQARELSDKLRDMRIEVKELEGALSDYLQEYQRMSGVNEIEGDDGEMHEIVYVAKLKRKTSF